MPTGRTRRTVELYDVDGKRFDADPDGRIVGAATTGTASGNRTGSGTTVEAPVAMATESTAETNTATSDTTPSSDESSAEPGGERSDTGTTTASGPGFTAVVALIAVVASALVAIRRGG